MKAPKQLYVENENAFQNTTTVLLKIGWRKEVLIKTHLTTVICLCC